MNASSPKAYTIAGIDSMQADRSTPRQLARVGDKVELRGVSKNPRF